VSAARDHRLYFHLQVAASRLRAVADRRCLEAAGITTAQAAALAVIQEQPGVSQRGLARSLHQSEPAVTTLVRRLIAGDLVNRTVGPSDGRSRALVLTDRGASALLHVVAAFAIINEHIDAQLASDEVRHVTDALRRLAEAAIGGSE
jgi:MarR family transcriptional regulator, organic hydroperoxide resistance regulator